MPNVDIATLKAANARRWQAMVIRGEKLAAIDAAARRLVAPEAKRRAQWVSARTGVPWAIVMVISEREGGGRFDRYLGNGQPLGQITTITPAGRGPFLGDDAWERGALDALIDCEPRAASWPDWSPGGALTLLERYNGLGYANMGRPSPYIWAGTDQYSSGKFVADHKYDPNAVDQQLGCAALLMRMMALDPSITLAGERAAPSAPPAKPIPAPPPAKKPSSGAGKAAGGAVVVGTGAAAAAHQAGLGAGAVLVIAAIAVLVGAVVGFLLHKRMTGGGPPPPSPPKPPDGGGRSV